MLSLLIAQVAETGVRVDGMTLRDVITYAMIGVVMVVIGWLGTGRRMAVRVQELTTQVFKLQDENLRCARENGELRIAQTRDKAELADLYRRVANLESQVGMGIGTPRVGVIIANLKGIIRAFSPTLSPVFRYLPEEVIGKPITFLMPADVAAQHLPKFKAVVSDPAKHVDRSKVILSYGRDKLGNKVPIALQLDDWQEGKEGFITATVRERVVGARVPSGQPDGSSVGSSAFATPGAAGEMSDPEI